jgi:hypothetical protein
MASRSAADPPSLLTHQTAALSSLLNLNQPSAAASSSSSLANGRAPAGPVAAAPVWKVLILDEASKDVLATSLRVQDLRDQGVTLHMCVARLEASRLSVRRARAAGCAGRLRGRVKLVLD